MKIKTLLASLVLLVTLLLCPLCGHSQTLRGDFNMDGRINISDVASMINYMLTDSPGEVTAEDRDTIMVNGVPFVMVRVLGGTYSSDALDNFIHTVETFSIGQVEVTKSQWIAVMDSLPSGSTVSSQYPVVGISWNQSQEFISKLNAVTGLNFRMPTLVEWEYAATGGNLTRGYRYAGSDNLDEVGWYDGNSGTSPVHKVGQLKPNELGLYDMSGNASEWCQDVIGSWNEPRHGIRGGDALSTEKACQTTTWPTEQTSAYIATGDESILLSGLRLAL